MVERLMWTVDEVAVSIGVPKKQVYQLIKDCELPNVQVGKHYRVPVDAVKQWIAERRAAQSESA